MKRVYVALAACAAVFATGISLVSLAAAQTKAVVVKKNGHTVVHRVVHHPVYHRVVYHPVVHHPVVVRHPIVVVHRPVRHHKHH